MGFSLFYASGGLQLLSRSDCTRLHPTNNCLIFSLKSHLIKSPLIVCVGVSHAAARGEEGLLCLSSSWAVWDQCAALADSRLCGYFAQVRFSTLTIPDVSDRWAPNCVPKPCVRLVVSAPNLKSMPNLTHRVNPLPRQPSMFVWGPPINDLSPNISLLYNHK